MHAFGAACDLSAFAEAELAQHAASVAALPGTLQLAGSGRRVAAGLRTRQGLRLELEGGSHQQRELTALALCADLPAAELLDETGRTRTVLLTHVETGLAYRITPEAGSIERSPHGMYWILRARQAEA